MQQQLPQPSPSYEADFYAWTQHQAKLLRAVKTQQPDLPEDLDLAHLAEEIEDLGKSELRGVTSLIRQILVHLIKAASDPASMANQHWGSDATAFNTEFPDLYTPSMRQLIDMDAIWKRALKVAERSLREHGAKLAPGLPRQCPFSLGEIISEDFDFDAALAKLRPAD